MNFQNFLFLIIDKNRTDNVEGGKDDQCNIYSGHCLAFSSPEGRSAQVLYEQEKSGSSTPRAK